MGFLRDPTRKKAQRSGLILQRGGVVGSAVGGLNNWQSFHGRNRALEWFIA